MWSNIEIAFWLNLLKKIAYFLTSISKVGIAVFIFTFIVSFYITWTYLNWWIFFKFLITLGLAFITTFLFEYLYNLIRKKSN